MGVDVKVETVIERPVDTVAQYAGDPSNAPEWYRRISSVEWKTDPPLRVGSRVAFVATFLGRRLEYTYEIVELEPGRRIAMQTSEGPFPMRTEYTWHADGPSATRMTLRNVGEPTGFSRFVAPLVSIAMRRAMRQDLRLLKRLMESS